MSFGWKGLVCSDTLPSHSQLDDLSSKNVCRNHRCVSCCYDTEMLLLDEDVRRIVGLGFKEDSFTVVSEGFKILKNKKGRCVFHDGKQCTIYSDRPAGCRLYPVILDVDLNKPVKDELCPYRSEFDLSMKAKQELSVVYDKLIKERRINATEVKEKNKTSSRNDP